MSSYLDWFIPLSSVVTVVFMVAIIVLTVATLVFRAQVNRKYDRGRPGE